ncbi:S-layer homology domain-containing protein [Phascolarctobacterium faecium]|uniref:S-layer homology domain-containing protein n=8 Tax=Phascolarctobacterium TaxID=33024 RepID=UPI003AB8B34D
MKNSLVLAMAMALGVTASAYAANPFSDVPAGHWAYDSVNKLASAGIVDGYGNGTFGGDRLMTRYEMAQIVAKAMAKGANVDRLAAEFADELDSLGVRVAALEKKSDNVRITGQVRYDYTDYSGDIDGYRSKLRSRISINGQINDDWKYVGMLQNDENLADDIGNEGTEFQRAYVVGKIGAVGVSAGRQNLNLADGNIYDTRYDGVNLTFGKEVKLEAFYGKPTNSFKNWGFDKIYGARVNGKIGALNAEAGWTKFEGDATPITSDDDSIWNVGATYNFSDKASLGVMYLRSDVEDLDGDKDGFVVTGTLGGAKASKPGSVGLVAKYYQQAAGTAIQHTMNGEYGPTYSGEGFKGYSVAGYYTVAKNMIAGIEYYDLKQTYSDDKMKTLWSQLIVTF